MARTNLANSCFSFCIGNLQIPSYFYALQVYNHILRLPT